jgi:predicted nucleotidyltransferase
LQESSIEKMLEKKIVTYFDKIPHVVAVTLFGSFARNAATDKSDVDVAVLFEKSSVPDIFRLLEIREEISALLNKDVDLICLNTASPIIAMQAFQNGKLLLKKDNRAYVIYHTDLFTDYAELKEIRQAAEQNILNRKFYDKS